MLPGGLCNIQGVCVAFLLKTAQENAGLSVNKLSEAGAEGESLFSVTRVGSGSSQPFPCTWSECVLVRTHTLEACFYSYLLGCAAQHAGS